MKIAWFTLTVLLGLISAACILSVIETAIFGNLTAQGAMGLVMGLVFAAAASKTLAKARSPQTDVKK